MSVRPEKVIFRARGSRVGLALLILGLFAAGCERPLPGGNDAGLALLGPAPSPAPWWDRAFAYRRMLTLSAGVTTPMSYAVSFDVDHSSLFLAARSLANGDDFRIVRQLSGVPAMELHRVVDASSAWNTAATRVWFQTQGAIGAGASDSSYYVYYGNAAAGSAPALPGNVFTFFDEFDDASLANGWIVSALGASTGCGSNESGSALRISAASTGAVGGTSDDICFAYRTVAGDFVAETVTGARVGTANTTSQFGGVMIRAGTIGSSILAATAQGDTVTHNVVRTVQGAAVQNLTDGPLRSVHRAVRIGGQVKLFQSQDGLTYSSAIGVDPAVTVALPDPVLVGPYLALGLAASQSIDIERFLVRPAVFPEPTIVAGAEQQRP